jgi:hypothetical protein
MGYLRSSGFGAVAVRNAGYAVPSGKRLRVILLPRGFGLVRGLGQTCPAGQVATPQYDGSTKCCGAPGTPPAADPCSILNNPAFLAAQATDVGPLGPNGVPLSAGTGAGGAELAEVAGYPNSVQTAAIYCWNNPGLTYTDPFGTAITCPSPSLNEDGILVSAYSAGQLAAMLSTQATPAGTFAGNQPFAGAPASSPAPVTTPMGGSYPLAVRLVNTSGGSNSSFNVGDSWQIVVTGPPNSSVTASASQNGTSLGSSTMGTIGSNGQLTLTGTFAASQVGQWTEAWQVAGQSAGSISFSVAAGGSGGGSPPVPAGGSGLDVSSLLNGSVTVGGTSVPYWALGLGAVGLLWFMGKR